MKVWSSSQGFTRIMTRYSLNIPKYCIINVTTQFTLGFIYLQTFTGRKSNLCDYFICTCWRLIWEESQISSQLSEAFITATRSQRNKLSPAITQMSFRRPISILTVKGCYLALVFSPHWFPENPSVCCTRLMAASTLHLPCKSGSTLL